MTIEKARIILQEEAQGLNDMEIAELIRNVGSICDAILDLFIAKRLTHENKEVYYG